MPTPGTPQEPTIQVPVHTAFLAWAEVPGPLFSFHDDPHSSFTSGKPDSRWPWTGHHELAAPNLHKSPIIPDRSLPQISSLHSGRPFTTYQSWYYHRPVGREPWLRPLCFNLGAKGLNLNSHLQNLGPECPRVPPSAFRMGEGRTHLKRQWPGSPGPSRQTHCDNHDKTPDNKWLLATAPGSSQIGPSEGQG